MKIKDLRRVVESAPREWDDNEVKVWLPGSRISIAGSLALMDNSVVLIEGNVDAGSALESALT